MGENPPTDFVRCPPTDFVGCPPTDFVESPPTDVVGGAIESPPPCVGGATSVACTLCQQEITTEGEHRLAGLRCGHVYGEKCIRDWIGTRDPALTLCPECNEQTSTEDMKAYYADHSHLTLVARCQAPSRTEKEVEILIETFTSALLRLESARRELETLERDLQKADSALIDATIRAEEVRAEFSNRVSTLWKSRTSGLKSDLDLGDLESRGIAATTDSAKSLREVEELSAKLGARKDAVTFAEGYLNWARERLRNAMMK